MVDVVMPQMGESIVEGTVTKWLKNIGDRVEQDEPLLEISTDKVDTEIPAPSAGILKEVLVQEGKVVSVSTVVARIDDSASGVAASASSSKVPVPPAKGTPAPPPLPVKPGPPVAAPLPAAAPAGPPAPATTPPEARVEASLPPPAVAPKTHVEPMSIKRQMIAEHMVLSKRLAPHVTSVHRVDMTRIVSLREREKKAFQDRHGFALTYMSFIAYATARALRAFRLLNASVEETKVIYHDEINLGIAVALDSGLIVPVVRNADEKSVVGLQHAITDLATRARSKQLKPTEVKDNTFSITNYGVFGTVLATPIINQPNVGILGVGAIEKTPVVIDDGIAIRSLCYLSITYDHRLIDGSLADQFCQHIKSALEGWSEGVL